MTALKLYREFLLSLSERYTKGESESITRMVFEDMVYISRPNLMKMGDMELPSADYDKLQQALSELKGGKPVQYITGLAWFYRLPFIVTNAVLIPRPETEELTDMAIQFLKGKKAPTVIDIGTGSGCISVSIQKNTPESDITAIDTSPDALHIAQMNAEKHQAQIRFKQLDFLQEQEWEQLGQYQLIISNPPYIPEDESSTMDEHVVMHEPGIALFVDNKSPLIFYEKILAFSKDHLAPDGIILMETHESNAEQVAALFQKEVYHAELLKDMYGKNRMVRVTRCR